MYKHLLTETQNHTLVIILNRPSVLNALNKELLMELGEVIEKLKSDEEVNSLTKAIGHRDFRLLLWTQLRQ